MPVTIECERDLGQVIPGVIVAEQRLRALGPPHDRAAEPPCCEQHQCLLWIREPFHAEAATDVTRHNPEQRLRNPEHIVSEDSAKLEWSLTRRVQGERTTRFIVGTDRAPGLHGVGADTVVEQLEAHNVFGRGKRFGSSLGVARSPVHGNVVGGFVPE